MGVWPFYAVRTRFVLIGLTNGTKTPNPTTRRTTAVRLATTRSAQSNWLRSEGLKFHPGHGRMAILCCSDTLRVNRADQRHQNAKSDDQKDDRSQAGDDTLRSVKLAPVGRTKIPPRPWAYGHFMLFGHASC